MYVVVGNFTIDHVDEAKRPGGPGYYSSVALALLGAKVYVLGYAGKDYPREVLEKVKGVGVDLSLLSMDSPTTIFVLEYLDLQTRVLKLLSRSPRIRIEEGYRKLGEVEASIVSPVAGEVSIEDLKYIREKTRILTIDVQGFIRVIGSEGEVSHKWDHGLLEELGVADIIHVEEGEAASIGKEPVEAALKLSEYTRIVALTMGPRGSIIAYDGMAFHIGVPKIYHGDETGAGDVYTAVLSYYYSLGYRPEDAARYATIAAGLKVLRSTKTLNWYTRIEVEKLAEEVPIKEVKSVFTD